MRAAVARRARVERRLAAYQKKLDAQIERWDRRAEAKAQKRLAAKRSRA